MCRAVAIEMFLQVLLDNSEVTFLRFRAGHRWYIVGNPCDGQAHCQHAAGLVPNTYIVTASLHWLYQVSRGFIRGSPFKAP